MVLNFIKHQELVLTMAVLICRSMFEPLKFASVEKHCPFVVQINTRKVRHCGIAGRLDEWTDMLHLVTLVSPCALNQQQAINLLSCEMSYTQQTVSRTQILRKSQFLIGIKM